MRFKGVIFASLIALTSLSACDREATGQVAAVVNGEEITLPELNAEIAAMQIPDSADSQEVRRQALQRIVERRLIAQAARDDNLDSSQDYLIRERQMRDGLLNQLLAERIERTTPAPDAQEIDEYIADNPGVFGNRKIFTIDRIQFPAPEDFAVLRPLEQDHSMAAVSERLNGLGIEFRRDQAQIDSATLGTARLEQFLALPEGEPFVVPENGVVTIGVITGERVVPLEGEAARPLAVRALRAERLNNALRQRLEQAKAAAEIEYQDGLAPAAPSGSPAPRPASPAASRN